MSPISTVATNRRKDKCAGLFGALCGAVSLGWGGTVEFSRGIMEHALQKTLQKRINCTGVGLHSGTQVSLTLHPAAPNAGIVFQRTDLPAGRGRVVAKWQNLHDGVLCTTLSNGHGTTIGTVEHLMAALAGCGIDNVVVELDGLEVPAMDGSAAPFVHLLECAGTRLQDAPRRHLRVLKPIEVESGDRRMRLAPADEFRVGFEIDFDSSVVAQQRFTVHVTEQSFKEQVGAARTFGFLKDVEVMRENGFGRGGTLENAVIVDGDKVLNRGGLRFADEFVRHKVLDLIGDLYLVGNPILAEVSCFRSGHSLTHRLLEALFADPEAWRLELIQAPERAVREAPMPMPAAVATA